MEVDEERRRREGGGEGLIAVAATLQRQALFGLWTCRSPLQSEVFSEGGRKEAERKELFQSW